MVNLAIANLFPNQTIPDEQNFRPDGTRFKAPDHFIPSAKLYIERKSLNPTERDTVAKINSIARSQGHLGFRSYGLVSVGSILRTLPDPAQAIRAFHRYWTNQMNKTLREVEKKYHSFFLETNSNIPTTLIISDHDDLTGSADTFEFAIGRMMESQPSATEGCKVGAVMYLRDPRSTMQVHGSHWCKVLLRRDLQPATYQRLHSTLIAIAKEVERALVASGVNVSWAGSSFRPLLV